MTPLKEGEHKCDFCENDATQIVIGVGSGLEYHTCDEHSIQLVLSMTPETDADGNIVDNYKHGV